MRPTNRRPMPDLHTVLRETNLLLAEQGLPLCNAVEPVEDQDTANPTLVGLAGDRRYVIKVCFRNPDALGQQLYTANLLRRRTELPIPFHFCCGTASDGLPLMVMEWMPGEQLRLMLPTLAREKARELAQDWGRCVGLFHYARIEPHEFLDLPDIQESYSGFFGWLRREVKKWIQELTTSQRWPESEIAEVQQFLAVRERQLDKPCMTGLVKSDQDVRDVLALADPHPHVSAMLDWERVSIGDPLWEIATVFVRLNLMRLSDLWSSFMQGYETGTGVSLVQGPHIEFYLMARAIRAALWNKEAAGMMRALLAGREIPFGLRE